MKKQVSLTNKEEKIEKIKNFTRFILELLGALTILTVAIIAPNTLMLFDRAGRPKRKFSKDVLKRNLYYLKTKGYAHISQDGDKTIIEVTRKGKKKALSYKLEELKIKKPKEWDGKWRIVIADVPEMKRSGRDTLRSTLKRIGFYQLQKSVWVHPYDCENEIEFLQELYELRPYLYFIVAETIKDDYKLKEYFDL